MTAKYLPINNVSKEQRIVCVCLCVLNSGEHSNIII